MLILGIDDAGRGPVIGPMVLAGVLLNEKTERKLKRLGVKDSKVLTAKRREFLDKKIRESVDTFEIVLAYPEEIDITNGTDINLNRLEALKTAEIINKINKGFKKIKVVIDCPSPGILSWADFLKTRIENLSNLEVSCEHKADKHHVAVAAASILAKNIREKEMDVLREKYGKEIGSGYASDKKSCEFVARNVKKYGKTGIFRKSWKTWKKACENIEQKKLF